MAQEKYDIFISYRRKDENGKEWGTNVARNVLQALEDRGYKGRVFFDHNKIGPEDFEKKILGAIKQTKVFLCILTKNAMDNCVNKGDWVRREICQALESGLKIIFLNPDNEFNHKLLPYNFPEELEIVKKQNSLEVRSGQKFNVDIDDIVERYISKFVPQREIVHPQPAPSRPKGILLIDTDLDCCVYNYGKQVGIAKAGVYTTFELPLGDNDLKYVGLECDKDCYGEIITILENHQKLVRIKLLDKYNTRKAKEEARIKAIVEIVRKVEEKAKRDEYFLSLPDEEFEVFSDWEGYGLKSISKEEIISRKRYEYAQKFHEGLAAVQLNGKWGYIDKVGKEQISMQYEKVRKFSEGLAPVKLDGKWGYINKYDNWIIPFVYNNAWEFKFGIAQVELNGKGYYIDKNGNRVK